MFVKTQRMYHKSEHYEDDKNPRRSRYIKEHETEFRKLKVGKKVSLKEINTNEEYMVKIISKRNGTYKVTLI